MQLNRATTWTLSAILGSLSVASAGSNLRREVCDAQTRIDLTKLAVANIKEPTAARSAAAYQAYPFHPDARIYLNPNEVGDLQVSYNKNTSVIFLGVIYQLITDVHADTYLNIDREQTFFNVTTDLGVLHAIPLPANVFFEAFLTFTLEPCQLDIIHVYAQVPSRLLGIFIEIATGIRPRPESP